MTSGLGLHVTHDRRMDWCYDLEGRQEHIRRYKPKRERPVRLKYLRLVPDEALPPALQKRMAALRKADAAFDKADAAYDDAGYDKANAKLRAAWCEADAAYKKAWAAFDKALTPALQEALHAQHCLPDCPWDGKTILP